MTTQMAPVKPGNRKRRRGSEVVEMSLCMVPMFCMIFVLVDIMDAFFVKATLEQALRIGVRYGITNHLQDAAGPADPYRPTLCAGASTVTACVKEHVQWAAGAGAGGVGGLLGGSQGANYISVVYHTPDGAVATGAQANMGGNVMVVTITNYPILTLIQFVPLLRGHSSTRVGVAEFSHTPASTLVTLSSADAMSSVLTYPAP